MALNNPEQKNYAEIERLERLLAELRTSPMTARETEAIREIASRSRSRCGRWARCSSTSGGSNRLRGEDKDRS